MTTLFCAGNNLTALDLESTPQLTELDLENNQVAALDVSMLPLLKLLNCAHNRLTSVDITNNAALLEFYCYPNGRDIEIDENELTFDLRSLPGKFDVSRMQTVHGGTVEDHILTVDRHITQVKYDYQFDLNKPLSVMECRLNIQMKPTSDPFKKLDQLKNVDTLDLISNNTETKTSPKNYTQPDKQTDSYVTIDEASFPDPVFRRYVIDHIDIDVDGRLNTAERNAVLALNLDNLGSYGLNWYSPFKQLNDLIVPIIA